MRMYSKRPFQVGVVSLLHAAILIWSHVARRPVIQLDFSLRYTICEATRQLGCFNLLSVSLRWKAPERYNLYAYPVGDVENS